MASTIYYAILNSCVPNATFDTALIYGGVRYRPYLGMSYFCVGWLCYRCLSTLVWLSLGSAPLSPRSGHLMVFNLRFISRGVNQ